MAGKALVYSYTLGALEIGGGQDFVAMYLVVNADGSPSNSSSVTIEPSYYDNSNSIWDKVVDAIRATDSSLKVVRLSL